MQPYGTKKIVEHLLDKIGVCSNRIDMTPANPGMYIQLKLPEGRWYDDMPSEWYFPCVGFASTTSNSVAPNFNANAGTSTRSIDGMQPVVWVPKDFALNSADEVEVRIHGVHRLSSVLNALQDRHGDLHPDELFQYELIHKQIHYNHDIHAHYKADDGGTFSHKLDCVQHIEKGGEKEDFNTRTTGLSVRAGGTGFNDEGEVQAGPVSRIPNFETLGRPIHGKTYDAEEEEAEADDSEAEAEEEDVEEEEEEEEEEDDD